MGLRQRDRATPEIAVSAPAPAQTQPVVSVSPPPPDHDPPPPRQEPEAPRQPARPTVEEILAASPGLPENAKNWLRGHPDYLLVPEKNQLLVDNHNTAKYLADGQEFSGRYFEKLEEVLGLRPKSSPAPQPQPQRPRYDHHAPPPAAPVHRETP